MQELLLKYNIKETKASLKQVDNLILTYSQQSEVRFKSTLNELKSIKNHLNKLK